MGVDNDNHRLLVGVGGTGKSTLLRTWVDEMGGNKATWLTGYARRPVTADKLVTCLNDADGVVVLDELQWFSDEALETLADRLDDVAVPVWASKRPWPTSDLLHHVSSLLTATSPAFTTGLVTPEGLRPIAAKILDGPVKAELTAWLHEHSFGSVGLCADIISTGWHLTPDDPMPEQLVYLLNQRVAQCHSSTEALAQLLAISPGLSVAAAVAALGESHDTQQAEHGLRASGFADAELTLLQPVAEAIRASITSTTKSELFTRLAETEPDPVKAATFALQGSSTGSGTVETLVSAAEVCWWSDPRQSIEFTRAALRIDETSDRANEIDQAATFRLGETSPIVSSASTSIQLGLAVRNMRWHQAISTADVSGTCQAMIELLLAETAPVATKPAGTIEGDTTIALRHLVDGKQPESFSLFSIAASDYDRLDHVEPADAFSLAFNPHRIGALAASAVGDIDASRILVRKAIASPTIEPAEHRTFELLAAYCNLVVGEYREALTATTGPQSGPEPGWTLREQLLWSSLNAGLARRSGDTTRLREAWSNAETVILEVSPSWIYLELLHDIVVAGARLEEADRIRPVVDELVRQANRIGGDVAIAASWLQLNVALAANQPEEVERIASLLSTATPVAKRAAARCSASQLWQQILASQRGEQASADERAVVECAERVAADADPWQASRLLGQAALDEQDPKAARRLLEKARDVVTEVGKVVTNNFGDLGLSDREAEVAMLVGQGHAYKKIGERLYISPKTVEHHVARIRQKLGASSRADMLKKINSRME